jgi:hypothetical protein
MGYRRAQYEKSKKISPVAKNMNRVNKNKVHNQGNRRPEVSNNDEEYEIWEYFHKTGSRK